MHKDGEPYMPANRADGDDFERLWCAHCLYRDGEGGWDDEFGNDADGWCLLLEKSFYGHQPNEWKYRNGRPTCTDFREDPQNRARCLDTLEMF